MILPDPFDFSAANDRRLARRAIRAECFSRNWQPPLNLNHTYNLSILTSILETLTVTKDYRPHFRNVVHSSLKPFEHSAPSDFPSHDRVIGIIARAGVHPVSHDLMIEVEWEIPSFVSSCRGEYMSVDDADGYIRAKALEIAAYIRETVEEMQAHADRLEEIALSESVLDEVSEEMVKRSNETVQTRQMTQTRQTAAAKPASSTPRPVHVRPSQADVRCGRQPSEIDVDEL